MDAFLQGMINSFPEQIFRRMPPVRLRKLVPIKPFAKSARVKNKENENPINSNMALQYSFVHSTPMKNEQVTDLDDVETETGLEDSELFGVEEITEEVHRNEEEEPKLVISKIYDLKNNCECVSAEESSKFPNDTSDTKIDVLQTDKLDNTIDKHWKSLENLHEVAEYEFCKSLEESKLFVSTSSLLEEIEADLPSPYSLAKPLSYTFHTLTSYRTQTRLARMDGNLTCPEILHKEDALKQGIPSKKIEIQLEAQAAVQKALVKQAEKALVISKTNKVWGAQNVECEKALLLANLRYSAAVQELKKLKILGEIPEKENCGQITISDICFDVNESSDTIGATYICTATERETVKNTSPVGEVKDSKLLFNDVLKFSNLRKDFVIYIDLFKLLHKETKKTLVTSGLKKRFKKITAVNFNRSLTGSNYSRSGFVCIAQCELRLNNVAEGKNHKCVIQNYLTVNFHHPIAGNAVSLLVKTDMQTRSQQSGFLNVFKETWHRRWFSQNGFFLESWHYPEDQECNKASLDSIYLLNCSSAEVVGLDVCIRPHSFIIKLKDTGERILFSANSRADMLAWIHHLNLMFELIDLWKPNF